MSDEEPPSLNSKAGGSGGGPPAAPPAGAFAHVGSSSGSAPPAAAFAATATATTTTTTTTAAPRTTAAAAALPAAAIAADDLNARWKQHQRDMDSRRGESSFGKAEVATPTPTPTASSYNKLNPKSTSTTATTNLAGGVSPRRVYSFNKSSSYDTNELIRKYSGVTGLTGVHPSTAAAGNNMMAPLSPSTSSFRSSATTPADRAVREEALQVLGLVDEHLNASFKVKRTESGGFRAAAAQSRAAPYHVRRTESGSVVVEHGGREGSGHDDDATQPYYVKRTASGTVTTPNGGIASSSDRNQQRRTPAALAGLGLTRTMSNSSQRSTGSRNSRQSWKAGRYSFTDPNFRDDDYMSGDEDDIVTMARQGVHVEGHHGFQDEPMDNVAIEIGLRKSAYSDYPDGDGVGAGFGAGDFPHRSSAWSSRYSTTKKTTKMLDQWDSDYLRASNSTSHERQSARNMFMSSAHNMRVAASSMGDAVASGSARVFGSGFSFRQNHTFGQQSKAGGTNLRTVWKDVEDNEDDTLPPGPRVHKTWQEVMLNKRKRRRVLLSMVCVVVAALILGLTLSPNVNPNRESDTAFAGSGEGTTVTFYATSDTPFDRDEEEKLAKDLSKIPNDAEFVMHLGNLQDAAISMCPETRPAEAASILQKSPVPLFVVPGEHDWVKCPRQQDAFSRWMAAFESFEDQFPRPMTFSRSANHPELFVTLHKGVLFFGLHLVNGGFEDAAAAQALDDDMNAFFIGMLNQYDDQYRAIVIMGNARPGPRQIAFFDSIAPTLNGVEAPVAYVHAKYGDGDFVTHTPFDNLDVLAIQVPNGGEHPPLKITVGFGSRPFMVG